MHWMQYVLYVVLVVWGGACVSLLRYAALHNKPLLAALAILLASPILIIILRLTFEEAWGGWKTIDPRHQYWSFLFGDTIVIPLAAAIGVIGWRGLDLAGRHSFYATGWWLVIAFGVGLAAGLAFHAMDVQAYTQAGLELALNAPTKWAHDGVAYTVLFGGILWLGLPLLVHRATWWGVAVLALVLLWVGLVIVHNPGPRWTHPKWDVETFSVVR